MARAFPGEWSHSYNDDYDAVGCLDDNDKNLNEIQVLYGEEEEELMASSPIGSTVRTIWDDKNVKNINHHHPNEHKKTRMSLLGGYCRPCGFELGPLAPIVVILLCKKSKMVGWAE